MANELTPEQRQQIDDHILAGRKLQAVKLLREGTGGDLNNAVKAIQAREAQLREASPDKFAPRGKGCMTAALLLLAMMLPAVAGICLLVRSAHPAPISP